MLNETRMLHSRSGPGEWGRDRIQGLAGVDISLWGPEVDVPADSRATPARNWLIPRVQNTRIEGHRKHCPWTLSVIHCRARTSDQPQSSRRTRFDHTLKWRGYLRTRVSPSLEITREQPNRNRNYNLPDEALVIFSLELFVGGCRDVKHGKRADDVKEQASEREVPSGTNPVDGGRVEEVSVPGDCHVS